MAGEELVISAGQSISRSDLPQAASPVSARVPPVVSELDESAIRQLAEAAPDGLMVSAADGRIVYVNRQLETISGYDRGELLGQPVELLVPDSSRTRHLREHAAYRAAPQPRTMGEGAPLELRRADGRMVPVEISLAPVRLSEAVMTAAAVRDVTVQRAAENRRRRMLAMMDLIPDAVLGLDADLVINYANLGAGLMLGYGPDELTGRGLGEFDPQLTPQRQAQLDREMNAHPDRRGSMETVFRPRLGPDIPVEVHAQVFDDPDSGRTAVLVARDARQRRAAERLRQQQADLATLVAEVSTHVLMGAARVDTYRLVVEGTVRTFRADSSAIFLPDPATGEYRPVADSGDIARQLPPEAFPIIRGLRGLLREHPDGLALAEPPSGAHPAARELVGPMAMAPLGRREAARGVLGMVRRRGREPFTDGEIKSLAGLAAQVALAVELGQARVDKQRLALLEERHRIARDLHDTVIQDMIAVGMQLNWGLPDPDPRVRERDDLLVDQLEGAIRRLRGAVFELRQAPTAHTVSQTLRDTVADAARALGFQPLVTLEGPVDDLPQIVVEQLLPVLREALSNVARHAAANTATVAVSVDATRAELVVEDDGRGLGARGTAGHGLTNLRERAAVLGGTATLEPGAECGTRLCWSVPRGVEPRGVEPRGEEPTR
jgi:PAS domain S-box-containing protein